MGSYWIQFIADETPSVQTVVDRCLELGLRTTRDGDRTVVERYTVDNDYIHADDGGDALDTVIDRLAGAEMGDIQLWHEHQMPLTVAFSHKEDQDWNVPKLIVRFDDVGIDPSVDTDDTLVDAPPEKYSRERVLERVKDIIDLVDELTVIADPEYVWSGDPHADLKPTGRPIAKNIPKFGWLTVLSPPLIDDLGGREHVIDEPAWKIDELETGHIRIVKTDNPFNPGEWTETDIDE